MTEPTNKNIVKELRQLAGMIRRLADVIEAHTIQPADMPKLRPPDDALIIDQDLSSRAQEWARMEGLQYVGQVRRLSDLEIIRSPNIGKKTLRELRDVIG